MADHEVVIMFKLFPPFVVLVGQQRTIRINSNCLWGIRFAQLLHEVYTY